MKPEAGGGNLRIKKVVAHVLQAPLETPFGFSQGWVDKRSSLLVELVCGDGLSGFGECLCHGLQPPQIAAAFVESCFAPRLIGRRIFDPEVIWEELYNLTRPFGQQGAAVNALSGVDIAVWDCLGRFLGRPISDLIGGRFRDRVRAYATGFYWRRDGEYPADAVR